MRIVIGILCALLALPAMILLSISLSYAQQEDRGGLGQPGKPQPRSSEQPRPVQRRTFQKRSSQPRSMDSKPVQQQRNSQPRPNRSQDHNDARDHQSPYPVASNPGRNAGYRPVTETYYAERVTMVPVESLDAKTGKKRITWHQQLQRVPRSKTTYVPVALPQHDPQVIKLANELRNMSEDDERRVAKTEELRELLDKEFGELHKKQSAEIERTEARLASLRKLHEQRSSNQDRIVGRRIEQLVGEPKELQWAPTQQLSQPGVLPNRPAEPYQPNLPQRLSSDALRSRSQAPVYQAPVYQAPGMRAPSDGGSATLRLKTELSRPVSPQNPSTPERLASGGRTRIPMQPPNSLAPPQDRRPDVALDPNAGIVYRKGQPVGVVQQRHRIEVTSSGSSELFELARRLLRARSAENAAQEEWKANKSLPKGAIPGSLVRDATLRLADAKRDQALTQAEWKALDDRIQRDLEYANNAMDLAQGQLRVATEEYKSGKEPRSVVFEAGRLVEQMKKAFDNTQAELKLFQAAKKLIADEEDPSSEAQDTEVPDAPTTDANAVGK